MTENLFTQFASAGVQSLTPYQPGKPIEELEREYRVENAIKLASNENPLGPSPLALKAMNNVLKGISRYPDGSGFLLKSALSSHLDVNSEYITLGNGSSDLLDFIARIFISESHEVLYSQYCFALYPLLTKIQSAKGREIPAKNFGHDLIAMAAAINDRTRLIYIANPNNPTGTWLSRHELESFLDSIPKHVFVVLDEAYYEYVDEKDYPRSIDWLNRHHNLLITRTFSKVYGLAGLRIGYGLSHPDLADLMNRVRPPFNVNNLALAAALAGLEDQEHIQRSLKINREGMKQFVEAFTQLGLAYIPSVANFITVDMGRTADVIYESLLAKGVIVRPIVNYGLPNHLRVTVGTKEENTFFIQSIKQVLEEI
ncbi:histidinol-phosphate transaminase [Candidatus Nitrosacidococcus sp. I8]|uniref:histidinol-phosphate transaminase n=1 Tax=Candidatus Nitrosacidococcus sp. I8 TaxID=2942908 RepID=UPI002226A1AC|nr:histidinol-phosphate transaminase [Candidatus Nitrosacidococcus sp. I8]CAH9018393.1 Histidinol-phosphate aminotransferase [Candidatus Nitrosacidococcus sp. I8]